VTFWVAAEGYCVVLERIPSSGQVDCPPVFKLFPTAVHCLPRFTEIMALSSRATGKG